MASYCIYSCVELLPKCSSAWIGAVPVLWPWFVLVRGASVWERSQGKQECLWAAAPAPWAAEGTRNGSGRGALPAPRSISGGSAVLSTERDATGKEFLLCWWTLLGTCAWASAPCCQHSHWNRSTERLGLSEEPHGLALLGCAHHIIMWRIKGRNHYASLIFKKLKIKA